MVPRELLQVSATAMLELMVEDEGNLNAVCHQSLATALQLVEGEAVPRDPLQDSATAMAQLGAEHNNYNFEDLLTIVPVENYGKGAVGLHTSKRNVHVYK